MSASGPLICAKFDPSNTYLASAVVALDTHQIKVQSINPSQASLNTSFNLENGSKLSTLSWISINQQLLIALALNNGTILIYSPLTNQIVSELTSPTNLSVTDFHYSNITSSAWSSDISGNIFEWDLINFSLIQHFTINDLLESNDTITTISSIIYQDEPHLLIGSHSVYLIEPKSRQIIKTFPAHVQPIHSIYPIPGQTDLFLTSAKGDRFVNLYSILKNSVKAVFVATSSVTDFSLGIKDESTSVLLIINETGNLEFFNNPLSSSSSSSLSSPSSSNPNSPSKLQSKKKRRQQLSSIQSRSSNASINLSRPKVEIKSPADSHLFINSITIHHDSFIFSWLENGNVSHFDSVKWLDESGEFTYKGDKVIEKSKPNTKSTTHAVNGHDIAASTHYNEGNAVVSEGTNFKNVGNVSDDEDDEDGETLADKLEKLSTDQKSTNSKKPKKKWNGGKNTNTATLTIILAQSLKNNDHGLLETVLMNRDPIIVQNTISRLDSSLAIILLDRLSERITRQASRFDQLNFWLKWIIIIHGGVLSSLPNLNTKLANLHAILNKKANTLPRLLELQGRLNMLYQQVDLKKEIMNTNSFNNDSDNDDEDDVEYIEEIDDARFNGDISEEDEEDEDDDELLDGHDDYIESEDDEGVVNVMDLEASEGDEEEEGYSDIEIDGHNDDIMEDEDVIEAAKSDKRIKNHIKNLKAKK